MKMLGLLLLSLLTAKDDIGVVGYDNSHDGAIIFEKSPISVGTNGKPLQRLRPQQQRRQQQQQTLNYRVNYTADFQHLVHPSCTGDVPVLAITCHGTNMTILSVSHTSIECTKRNVSTIQGTTYVCTNDCTEDDTCSSVYATSDFPKNAFDGPYGSIRFLCEGNNTQDVNAEFYYASNSKVGTCIADSTTTAQSNLHVARLGVSCPIATNGDESNGVARQYVFDDTYFECRSRNISTADTAAPPNDVYTCFSGQQCNGQGCSFEFDPIQVVTEVPNFAKDCVQALVPIDRFPTPAPQAETSLYQVRFEASWLTINTDANCVSNSNVKPKIRIACDNNGESTIVFANATDPTMQCVNVEQNALQCTGDPSQSSNQFTSVAYDCYGTNIPTSTVTYPESDAFCEDNVFSVYLVNRVSLGIVCNGITLSNDRLIECSSSQHDFFMEMDQYNVNVLRFMCSEETLFDSNSLVSDVKIIPSVSITTDEYWQSNTPEFCYQQSNLDTMAPPVTIFAPVPTFAPIQTTAQPITPVPTFAPMQTTVQPIKSQTTFPVSSIPVPTPITQPDVVPPIPTTLSPVPLFQTSPTIPNNGNSSRGGAFSSNEDSTEGNNKVLIISAVGGVIGGIIISALLLMVYSKGKHDAVVEDKGEPFPREKDHTESENNTESHYSPNMQQSSNQTGAISPDVAAALVSAVPHTMSDYYEVHYKDQSRSVIGTASGHTTAGRSSNDKTPPIVASHYRADYADNTKHPKPTSGIEIPTVTAIMCTEISMLGESDSAIRRLGDSSSSLRMIGESNRSFRMPSVSNSTIATESNTGNVRNAPSTISHLVDSNSSLSMIGESNRSFHILNDSNSTIPTVSNTDSNHYNRKKPAFSSSVVEL